MVLAMVKSAAGLIVYSLAGLAVSMGIAVYREVKK